VDAEGTVVQPARLDLIGLFEADTHATPAHLVDVAREKCGFPTDAPLVCIEEITSQPRHDCQCAVAMDKSLHDNSIQDGDILVWAVANHGDAVQQLQEVREYYSDVWYEMDVEFRDANSPNDATARFTRKMVRTRYPPAASHAHALETTLEIPLHGNAYALARLVDKRVLPR
jgi:hypothetical protein